MFSQTPEELRKELIRTVPLGWTVCAVGDIAELSSGTTPARSRNALYFERGTIPWIKTGDLNNHEITEAEEKITPLAAEQCKCQLYQPGTVLVSMYGGFRQIGRTGILRVTAATNQAITAIQVSGNQVSPEYAQEWLNAVVPLWRRIAASSRKDPNITRGDIARLPIPLPPLEDQKRIASIGRIASFYVAMLSRLVELKQEHRRGMRERLISGDLRFPEFHEARKVSSFTEVTAESKRRSGVSDSKSPVFGVTKEHGFVPPKEGSRLGATARYKIVFPSDFAYNPMRLNIGSIAQLKAQEAVLVSPDYVVFSCRAERLCPGFLEHFRKTSQWRSFVRAAGNGSVRVRIYYKDLGRLCVSLPSVAEQEKISSLLDAADEEIRLLTQLSISEDLRRRWFMERLLTGRIIAPRKADA